MPRIDRLLYTVGLVWAEVTPAVFCSASSRPLRLLGLQHFLGDDADGERSIDLPGAAEASGLHEIRAVALAVGGDDDLLQDRPVARGPPAPRSALRAAAASRKTADTPPSGRADVRRM